MNIINTIIIAVVQGIAELLPISSSTTVEIVMSILKDNRPKLIELLHGSNLIAILIYLRADIKKLIYQFFQKQYSQPMFFVVASIPVIITAFIFNHVFKGQFTNQTTMAFSNIIFGGMLLISDLNNKSCKTMTIKQSLTVGMMQILALIRGVSRLGICLTTLRYIGHSRANSIKISLLLAIPPLLGAFVLRIFEITKTRCVTTEEIIAMTICATTSLLSINLIMRVINKFGFIPFAIYRIIIGSLLLFNFISLS